MDFFADNIKYKGLGMFKPSVKIMKNETKTNMHAQDAKSYSSCPKYHLNVESSWKDKTINI